MKRGSKVWLGVAGVFLLVGGGSYLAYRNSDIGRAADELPSELALTKKLGLALEPADLMRTSIPGEQNAALVLKQITKPSSASNEAFAAFSGPGVSATDDANLRRAIAAEKANMDLMRKAGTMAQCRFPRKWEQGYPLMPEFSDLKRSIKMLCAAAEIEVADGDIVGGFRDLDAAAQIAKHSGADPVTIALLVRLSCEMIVEATLERMLARHGNNPEVVRFARATFGKLPALPTVRATLDGEVVGGRIAIRDMARQHWSFKDLKDPNTHEELRSPLARTSLAMSAYETRLLQLYQAVAKAATSNENLLDQYRAILRIESSAMANDKPSYAAVRMLSGSLAGVALGNLRLHARRVVLDATIGVFEHKLSTGSFPDKLPPTFVDPLDGKHLRYEKTKKGYRLWSIGTNFVDDGGLTQSQKQGADDLVSQFPPLPVKQRVRLNLGAPAGSAPGAQMP